MQQEHQYGYVHGEKRRAWGGGAMVDFKIDRTKLGEGLNDAENSRGDREGIEYDFV
jgi:hypothetical protein